MMKPLSVAIALLLTACSSGASERCSTMCKREAECAEKLAEGENFKYDADECVTACVALERDPATKKLVDRHQECAKAAETCEELMGCR